MNIFGSFTGDSSNHSSSLIEATFSHFPVIIALVPLISMQGTDTSLPLTLIASVPTVILCGELPTNAVVFSAIPLFASRYACYVDNDSARFDIVEGAPQFFIAMG